MVNNFNTDKIFLIVEGQLLTSTQVFTGTAGGTLTITPTSANYGKYFLMNIHWMVDTGLTTGGTNVSVQIFYQFNGSDRIRWSSVFAELINDEMDDNFNFVVDGVNHITVGVSLGATSQANGYVAVAGVIA